MFPKRRQKTGEGGINDRGGLLVPLLQIPVVSNLYLATTHNSSVMTVEGVQELWW